MNINIFHHSVSISSSFEKFTLALESDLGRFEPAVLDEVQADPQKAVTAIKNMQGKQDLMLFSIEDHGQVLLLMNRSEKARQYRLGNPLIAMSMTNLDLRAGLYVPLTLLVYEKQGKVWAEYDQPSSLLGQFSNTAIRTIAEDLDQKIYHLITGADRQA